MKVKFGAIVVDGRNKIGGHVLSKNRAGAYMRTKTTPVNPQTVDQVAVRNRFTTLSQNWRGLTDAQRLGWASQVDSFQKTDIFGDLKAPSPLQLYMRINGNLGAINIAPIAIAPVPGDTPSVDSLEVVADFSGTLIEVDTGIGAVPANTSYLIEATGSVSPGKTYVKNQYRVVSVAGAATVIPIDIYADYVAKFGAIAVGQVFYVRVTPISVVSGLRGQALSVRVVVVA